MTLDQVEVFLAVVATGSFSEAARALGRAQSAVTYAVQKLEEGAQIELFDRSAYRPVLSDAGRALLPRARRIADDARAFRAQAAALAQGVEGEVSLTVDAMFPMCGLLSAVSAFRERWPAVSLRVMVENLGASAERVLNGGTAMGVMSELVSERPELERRWIGEVLITPVASPTHPLAAIAGVIPGDVLQDHVQLVLTDRSSLSAGREFGVLSAQTWRLSDLGAKHAMLLAGLGWGGMPLEMVSQDLIEGRLVKIAPEGLVEPTALPLFLAWRRDQPLGPATRWLADQLISGGELAAQPSDHRPS